MVNRYCCWWLLWFFRSVGFAVRFNLITNMQMIWLIIHIRGRRIRKRRSAIASAIVCRALVAKCSSKILFLWLLLKYIFVMLGELFISINRCQTVCNVRIVHCCIEVMLNSSDFRIHCCVFFPRAFCRAI